MRKYLDVDAAIERGLAFLAKEQETDGSFISFSSASVYPFRRVRSWQTVFVPALMLISLASLDGPEALDIRKKLAKFLLDQKHSNWSFNYWARSAPEYANQPYPNDLDDTFCALAGLYLHDPSLVNSPALAKIVKLLLATETAVGGPYRTWLVSADSQTVWLDVDIAVNSNIAYFLSLASNRLPRLDSLIGQAIADDSFSSPYYPSEYAFLYYFGRAYEGPHKHQLLRKTRRAHKIAQTDLDRALCLSVRLRLGETQNLSGVTSELLGGQRRDGSWPAAVFYADPVKNGKLYYNGASALTTAFVLEALQMYKQAGRAMLSKAASDTGDNQKLRKAVMKLAEKQCRDLDKNLRNTVIRELNTIAMGSNGMEIISLGARFSESLVAPPKSASPDFIKTLGLANLYGWLAYTIYDDFLDEAGKPELISVANAAVRRSLDNFSHALPANQKFGTFVRQSFDTIDSANAWELANCRFKVSNSRLATGKIPNYGDLSKLAERSIGHALSPMAVMAVAGKGPNTAAAQNLLTAFRHYLIVRQLNDDAHDWPEDLQNGHITPVVAWLLAELKLKPGDYKLADLLTKARPQFWSSTLLEICRLQRRHIRLSRQALKRCALLQPRNTITDLLDNLEASIKDTLHQQSQAKDFLKQYKSYNKIGAKA
jgi:hypothetical protein